MAKDALKAHARDELGLSEATAAHPIQAAAASAASFALGAAAPLLVALFAPPQDAIWLISVTTLVVLGMLGGVGARIGGAPIGKAVVRVIFWGAMAMLVTAGVGRLFGTRAA